MRRAALLSGLALLAAVWLVPLDPIVGGSFTAHMLRHMALVTLVPVLLVIALPALRARLDVSPLVASALELVVVWGWHVPVLHDAARAAAVPFALEQLAFLGTGLLVWGSALQPGRALAGAGALLLTSMHMTLLGALIVLSPAPLYLCTSDPLLALGDQRLGGIVMLAVGTPIYLLGGLALVHRALRGDGERPRAGDGRDDDTERDERSGASLRVASTGAAGGGAGGRAGDAPLDRARETSGGAP